VVVDVVVVLLVVVIVVIVVCEVDVGVVVSLRPGTLLNGPPCCRVVLVLVLGVVIVVEGILDVSKISIGSIAFSVFGVLNVVASFETIDAELLVSTLFDEVTGTIENDEETL
jgi:hypothetical protein